MSGWPSGLRRQTQESNSSEQEYSGPRMWAGVRIPLLTKIFGLSKYNNKAREKQIETRSVLQFCTGELAQMVERSLSMREVRVTQKPTQSKSLCTEYKLPHNKITQGSRNSKKT